MLPFRALRLSMLPFRALRLSMLRLLWLSVLTKQAITHRAACVATLQNYLRMVFSKKVLFTVRSKKSFLSAACAEVGA